MVNHTLIRETCRQIQYTLENLVNDLHMKNMKLKKEMDGSENMKVRRILYDSETDYSDDETNYDSDSSD